MLFRSPTIVPKRATLAAANLRDYDEAAAAFSWAEARAELDGLPAGGINIAHEAVDRHARGDRGASLALVFLAGGADAASARAVSMTYAQLAAESNRFANVLASLGVCRGDRVFALAPRHPSLYVAALGTLKSQCVFSPLFPAFGPEPIRTRMTLGEGRVLVTTSALYSRKIAQIRSALPRLEHVLLIDVEAGAWSDPGVRALGPLLDAASPEFTIAATRPETPALLHFTSGTTGTPKGAVHVHAAVLAHHVTDRKSVV